MAPTEHGRSKQSSKQVYWHISNNVIYEKKKISIVLRNEWATCVNTVDCELRHKSDRDRVKYSWEENKFLCSEYVTFIDSDLFYKRGKRNTH